MCLFWGFFIADYWVRTAQISWINPPQTGPSHYALSRSIAWQRVFKHPLSSPSRCYKYQRDFSTRSTDQEDLNCTVLAKGSCTGDKGDVGKATGDRNLSPKSSCFLLTVADEMAVWEKAAAPLLYRNITRIWSQLSMQQHEQNRKTLLEQITVLFSTYQHGSGYLYRPQSWLCSHGSWNRNPLECFQTI